MATLNSVTNIAQYRQPTTSGLVWRVFYDKQ